MNNIEELIEECNKLEIISIVWAMIGIGLLGFIIGLMVAEILHRK